MVTGGFRTAEGMNSALESNSADLIGVARPLCFDKNCTQLLLNDEIAELPRMEQYWNFPTPLNFRFLLRSKFLSQVRTYAMQMVLYNNFTKMGKNQFTNQSEKKYPNILYHLAHRYFKEGTLARKLKGFDPLDPYLQRQVTKRQVKAD